MANRDMPTIRLKTFPRCEGTIKNWINSTTVSVQFAYGSTLFPNYPLSSLELTPYGQSLCDQVTLAQRSLLRLKAHS